METFWLISKYSNESSKKKWSPPAKIQPSPGGSMRNLTSANHANGEADSFANGMYDEYLENP